ncbi:MAG TPA: B12-binding domain-containing radical SAM protein, partial [Candidatus Rokubacteria bacterium]|nr:B12-binding domain-containing radical SAM protein [Candidatus Rokubacteria bacterium]
VRGHYRRTFWRTAWPLLRARKLEELINVAVVSHHLIEFTRDCLHGEGESSFYAPEPAVPASQATATV